MAENERNQQKQGTLVLLDSLRVFRFGPGLAGE